jgi:hypothetical protein
MSDISFFTDEDVHGELASVISPLCTEDGWPRQSTTPGSSFLVNARLAI